MRFPLTEQFEDITVCQHFDNRFNGDPKYCQNNLPYDPVSGIRVGWLCGYHDKTVLSKKLTQEELAKINFDLYEREVDGWSAFNRSIIEGVILTESREIPKWPIKVLNGLRIHQAPPVPPILDSKTGKPRVIFLNPDWEKVNLNKVER
jgi:hypothetical protein